MKKYIFCLRALALNLQKKSKWIPNNIPRCQWGPRGPTYYVQINPANMTQLDPNLDPGGPIQPALTQFWMGAQPDSKSDSNRVHLNLFRGQPDPIRFGFLTLKASPNPTRKSDQLGLVSPRIGLGLAALVPPIFCFNVFKRSCAFLVCWH